MGETISYSLLLEWIGPRLGVYDVACPQCGPGRLLPKNRARPVLRVWHEVRGFMTYCCARCGARGYARVDGSGRLSAMNWSRLEPSARPSDERTNALRRDRARWLWSRRRPIAGTPAEIYLRRVRCYGGPLPATLAFLPSHHQHPPAMIAGFGLPDEREPAVISISDEAVAGVHLTRLAPGGASKAGTETDKIMVGRPLGSPIVVAPPNDLGGLAITEGIEDALSVHDATGLGAWAAGAASFMPALAAAVPNWIECITILVDHDEAGQSNADALAEGLERRRFSVRLVYPIAAGGPLA